MDLGTEVHRKCCWTSQDPVIRYSVAPVPWRGELRSKESGKKSIHFNGSTQNIELLLKTVTSVNQLSIYGAVAEMIEELPVGQRAVVRELWRNPKHQVNWIMLRLLRNLLLHKCKPMKSDRETCCKNTSNDLNIVRRPEVIQTMLRSRFDDSRNWTILVFSSVTKRRNKSIFMPRIHDASRSRRNSYQKVDPKQCTTWSRLGHTSLQSLRKIQHWSSGSIFVSRSNRILDSNRELYWKSCQRTHADPRGRESFGETRCKSETNIKPSSTSGWDFTLIEQRQWIDTETQESNDPYCFQVSKFITGLLRHSQEVYRDADGAVHYDEVVDECKEMQSDNAGYWSDEMKKDFVNAPHWSKRWVSVLKKGGGQKKRFQYYLNPNYPHQFLYLRAIQGHSGRTINLALQDNVLLPEGFTEYFYHVGNGTELRSTVNHGLISGGVSLRTGRQVVFFTIVNPMDNQDGLAETACCS